ncbi:Synaptobrevin [Opisthorchis viverrini]|nr:Synaptobrevin [Opisthorchis viverrini]
MTTLQANVEGVTNVLRDNLEQIMKRGQLAGELAEKTEELEGSAQMFKQISKKVESHERSKHRRLKFIMIGVGLAILLVIILIILWQTGVFKSH